MTEQTSAANRTIRSDRKTLERIAIEIGETAKELVKETDTMPAAFQLASLSSRILGLAGDLGKIARKRPIASGK